LAREHTSILYQDCWTAYIESTNTIFMLVY